ncbi:LOW QUALITY PROTEIN: ciliary microtubule inner protein 4, partial [Cyrtonyx montezumae]|uniref:LOW QUALITY PROTEIN: ciliary microtubule inner protein 4 n=1 Tax=Cyrtonyx montezumae TaxID=9017 RepID=UPI0032DAAD4F
VKTKEGKKKHLPADLGHNRQRTSQKTSSRASCKISKTQAAQGTTKNSTCIKSKISPSVECIQTKRQSKQHLQAKTPYMQNHHSRRLEEEGGGTSATKDPRARLEPRSRNNVSRLSAASREREAESSKSMSNGKELVSGQQQAPGSKMPGSLWKTTKTSCEKNKKTCRSACGSISSLAPDMKAEWKVPLEKKNSSTHSNSKSEFASADKLTNNEEERLSLCMAAIIIGQKRLSNCDEMLKKKLEPFTDYNELGFNLRSNIFQGGPLECRSLMKDSYTPDVFQKATRDPKNWHGRRTDEIGKWHEKNALNLNLQKTMEEKYGKKNVKP